MMSIVIFVLAAMTVAAAVAAMLLRKLVHGVLCLVVALGGLACIYLGLGAQFVGLAQLLVYVGAVAILLVFAILLTRGEALEFAPRFVASWGRGVLTAGVVGLTLVLAITRSHSLPSQPSVPVEPSVREIGVLLMTTHVIALEAIGVLLTAALIGAVVLAMRERRSK